MPGNYLFINEMKRLGGINSIRGFNENFFFASEYSIFAAEWRYYLEQATYFSLFVDAGYIMARTPDITTRTLPVSTGVSLHLDVGKSQFYFTYALGRSALQPFGLQYAKIHFGLRSHF